MALILTDSTCDLTLQQLAELEVEMLSLKVRFGEEEFEDKRELTNEAFYQRLADATELPTTSLLSPDAFLKVFDDHPEDIVVLTISHKLSGTWQSACIAKEITGRKNIYLPDSHTVSGGLALLVQEAVRLNRAGCTGAQIAAHMDCIAPKVRLMAVIDTLTYLVKGGRLSAVSGAMGGLLQIKPVITLFDGEIIPVAKARGQNAALQKLKQLVTNNYPMDETLPCCFCHTNAPLVTEQLAQVLDLSEKNAPVISIGSVVGTHAGPGAAAFVYFEQQKTVR